MEDGLELHTDLADFEATCRSCGISADGSVPDETIQTLLNTFLEANSTMDLVASELKVIDEVEPESPSFESWPPAQQEKERDQDFGTSVEVSDIPIFTGSPPILPPARLHSLTALPAWQGTLLPGARDPTTRVLEEDAFTVYVSAFGVVVPADRVCMVTRRYFAWWSSVGKIILRWDTDFELRPARLARLPDRPYVFFFFFILFFLFFFSQKFAVIFLGVPLISVILHNFLHYVSFLFFFLNKMYFVQGGRCC